MEDNILSYGYYEFKYNSIFFSELSDFIKIGTFSIPVAI
jgi:hypothetical protein